MLSIRAAVSASLVLLLLAATGVRAHDGYHPGFDAIPPGLNDIAPKDEPPTLYLLATRELTEADIPSFVGETVSELVQEARRLDVAVVGPLTFIFRGRNIDGQPFEMDIALPVMERNGPPAAGFAYREEPALATVSGVYKGPMGGINGAWSRVLATPDSRDRAASGQDRELYLHWVRPDSPNNVIDLQHGVR